MRLSKRQWLLRGLLTILLCLVLPVSASSAGSGVGIQTVTGTATLSASPTSGCRYDTINFSFKFSSSGSALLKWHLSYGDGYYNEGWLQTNSTGTDSHIYGKYGTFTTEVVFYDNGIPVGNQSTTISINCAMAPVLN